jgi:hypothetical protein
MGAVVALVIVGLAGLVLLLASGWVTPFLQTAPLSSTETTRSTQVVEAVTREQEVVLLSLGIQGIEEKSANSTFFGLDVPGSERTAFMRYEFAAKLGFDGADVAINETAASEYSISIPQFDFIGHEFISEDGAPFKMVVQSGGALSWVTPEIDDAEMINRVLSEGARSEYIEIHRELLQEQAEAFYSGLVRAVDPDAKLIFEFE